MYKNLIIKVSSLLAAVFTLGLSASAFPTSHYASNSVLASGKWVKIAVSQNGIYELTQAELAKMGFSNPANVRIYGQGGHMISEVLNGNAYDDLKQVPVLRSNGKICFYANGPVRFTLTNPASATPYYKRTVNTYSTHGYYFLTESSAADKLVPVINNSSQGTVKRESSLDYDWHEQDLASYSQSGKDLLGEELQNGYFTYNTRLHNLVENTPIYVNTCIGAKTTAAAYIGTTINGNDVPFTSSRAKIYQPSSTYVYYNSATPVAAMSLAEHSEDIQVTAGLTCSSGNIISARLDYVTLTYQHKNAFYEGGNGQFRMGLNNITSSQRIEFPENPQNLVVWQIDNPQEPQAYATATYTYTEADEGGNSVTRTVKAFSPAINSQWTQFIAFDPTQTLLKIDSYESVDNQNLHSMTTPDMLIITNKNFHEQAQRIADLHFEVDGLSVAVVDQELIFNEFSSGTPDAMAYRLMCKMLYDRSSSKFKYLLLFGAGSFDNRALIANRDFNILTYKTTTSNDEDYSYTSDDFFGLLDDNSGTNIAADFLRIGIGRFPSANLAEAKSDVDKLVNYVKNPDYGPWRNNIMLSADEGDDGLHAFQAEGVRMLVDNELETNMQTNRVFIGQYPKANETWIADETRRTASEAKRRMTDLLSQGQYFASYIGHAGPSTFTKLSHLWTSNDAQSFSYKLLPIFTTAACDVARYDSDQRGIAEHMFHKRDGGAIALLTSSRSVYAESNDALNTAFVRNLFCYNTLGFMPTVGYAYMKAKQSFGNSSNTNKMSFLLLGDPAMQINYPKGLVNITKINDNTLNGDTVLLHPLTQVTIEARITDESKSATDETFNGDVTISLYDQQRYFASYTQRVLGSNLPTTRDCYYSRDLLTEVNTRATNGIIRATITVPRSAMANGQQGLLRIYAHRDDSKDMVNGYTDRLKIASYDETLVTNPDTEAPVINAMYIDAESFSDGDVVNPNATLFISASDNEGINMQSISLSNSMTLVLDGSTSFSTIKNFAATSQDGKLTVAFPLSSLTEGKHTLKFTVYDLSGNATSRSINFVVASEFNSPILAVEESPAIDKATFTLSHEFETAPSVTLKVIDVNGDIVWSDTATDFPYEWDLTDKSGQRLPAGVYEYYGTVRAGNAYGGTTVNRLIIVEPLKRAN